MNKYLLQNVFVFPVICLLEGSGQWPDDKDAFRRIKAALHIKLGEVLSDQQKIPVVINTDHVNIKFVSFNKYILSRPS